jgi:hypothetical protein
MFLKYFFTNLTNLTGKSLAGSTSNLDNKTIFNMLLTHCGKNKLHLCTLKINSITCPDGTK